MAFFGGMDITSHVTKELKDVETLDSFAQKMEEAKSKIVSVLNKCGDVTNITDLYKSPPFTIPGFNPIVFNLRIPFSLQKVHYRHLQEQDSADVQNFVIVYDGGITMITAVCSLDKHPWGVYDARDRFEELLKLVCEFKETAPCLTHEAVVFVTEMNEKTKDPRDIYTLIPPNTDFLSLIQDLYLRLSFELWSFYSACATRFEIDEIVFKIQDLESRLLMNLKNFMISKWSQFLKRRELIRKIRLDCIEILEKLSDYSSSTYELRKSRADIKEHMAHNDLFKELVQKVDLDEYTKPEVINSDPVIREIEHSRGEVETYSVNFSAIISALIGAIIGSILTIIASYLLGFLP